MRSALESTYQTTRETDRQMDRAGQKHHATAAELGAKMLLTQDEIRFLVRRVYVCRHLGRGFSPFPLRTGRQPLRGGWIRGQWVQGDQP